MYNLPMKPKEKRRGIPYVALRYSNTKDKFLYIILALLSLLSSSCNVLLPVLEKVILEKVNPEESNLYLFTYLGVALISTALIILVNFLNIKILYRLRHELEKEMIHSLALQDPSIIKEKGAGSFSSAIIGDSDTVATMVAGNWFALTFNLIGAIISIFITSLWYMPFTIIACTSYAIIIVLIIFLNHIQVKAFKKGKEETYYLSPRMLEIVEENEEIQSYQEMMTFESFQEEHFKKRDRYQERASQAEMVCKYSISGVQILATSALLFFAIHDIQKGNLLMPTLTALISFLETIFVPISSLSTAYSNIAKFKAFYKRIAEFIDRKIQGIFPQSLDFKFEHVNLEKEKRAAISNIDFFVDENISLLGLSGEEEHLLQNAIKGHEIPTSGRITLGKQEIHTLFKHLRLSLLRISPELRDVYDRGLEFNITLGKELLSEEEYNQKLEDYLQGMKTLLENSEKKELFRFRNRKNTYPYLNDLLSVSKADLKGKAVRKEIEEQLCSIEDKALFINKVGTSLFSRKYARKKRYDDLVSKLNLERLHAIEFGVRGQHLSKQDRVLVQTARFLLPDNDDTFLLIHPLVHLNHTMREIVTKVLREYTVEREGIIFTNDCRTAKDLGDKIAVFEKGQMIQIGTDEELVKSCPLYQEMWKKQRHQKEE